MKIKNLIVALSAIAGIFIAGTSVIYLWLLPMVATGFKTHFFFFAGVICAAIVSYLQSARYVRDVRLGSSRLLLQASCAVAVSVVVCLGSLFVILNVGGA